MKESKYNSYDALPLFLNAELISKVLGVSPSSGYELMRVVANSASFAPAQGPGLIRSVAPPFPTQTLRICVGVPLGFPTLRIGSRMVVPKEKFIQRWPSYRAIGRATRMSKNTVRKYVRALTDRGLIATEETEVITKDGLKRNGNLKYTILPIQDVVERFYQRQLDNNGVTAV